MPLPTATDLAARVKTTWQGLDPTGFGSLAAADQDAAINGLVTALCTEVLAAITEGTVSVNGSTSSACSAGGSSGTCTATGSVS